MSPRVPPAAINFGDSALRNIVSTELILILSGNNKLESHTPRVSDQARYALRLSTTILAPVGFAPCAITPGVPSPTASTGGASRLPCVLPGGPRVRNRPLPGISNTRNQSPLAVRTICRLFDSGNATAASRTPGIISGSNFVLCSTTPAWGAARPSPTDPSSSH